MVLGSINGLRKQHGGLIATFLLEILFQGYNEWESCSDNCYDVNCYPVNFLLDAGGVDRPISAKVPCNVLYAAKPIKLFNNIFRYSHERPKGDEKAQPNGMCANFATTLTLLSHSFIDFTHWHFLCVKYFDL